MKFILSCFTILLLSATCGKKDNSEQQKLLTEIQALESKLMETGNASKVKEDALQLIEKSMQYVKEYPKDTICPTLLFKAAEVSRGAGNAGRAVQLWGQVWRNYGQHPRAPMALFLQGFTFDSELRQGKMAAQYYQEFLKQYPNDPLAAQVKQLLAVVEKSPEEMVKEFEKNKED
jgi:outer membrane protein assembly factor BamD (BamD/ComL family)